MYVKLVKYRRFQEPGGAWVLHYPGEILNIANKAICKQLIKEKIALDMSAAASDLPKGCGLVMKHEGPIPAWATALELEMAQGEPRLPFVYTIIWDQHAQLDANFVTLSLGMLQERGWDMCAPIWSYLKLANKLGSPDERKRTEELIHDLRVPVYNTDLIIAKRNDRTKALMAKWAEERKTSADEKLAFLRALYVTRPFMLALPALAIRER